MASDRVGIQVKLKHGPRNKSPHQTRAIRAGAATTVANRRLHPETLMMGYGYAPGLSEGSLKPPIFLTSTFVFENAQQGKDFFDLTSGRRQPRPGEKSGLVYSRFNNPNLEILEDRLAIWDQAERSAVFASGMAAISTTLFAFLRSGDTVLHSRPLYGGTETLLQKQMGALGVTAFGFPDGISTVDMRKAAEVRAKGRVGLILVETPANPTNGLVDLTACAAIADDLARAQGHSGDAIVDARAFLAVEVRGAEESPLRDNIAPLSWCFLYSMERIWISWSPTKTTSSTTLPIKARATERHKKWISFRGSASSSPTILNAWRRPSSRSNVTRCSNATASNSRMT